MDMRKWQGEISYWVRCCFGRPTLFERRNRFLEEALELFQSSDGDEDDAIKLIQYVFSRPIGGVVQEIGGVAVTLAALCQVLEVELSECSEAELKRIWEKFTIIQAKNNAKNKDSALP